MTRPALIALVVLAAAPAALAEPLRKGPYLQNVTTTAITVMFETAEPTTATVYFGATKDYGRSATSGRKRIHEVRLEGLEPSTIYHYQVEADGATSRDRRFTTAAQAGEPFRFLVYGDNRDGNDAHARVVAAMRAEDADLVVNTGDMVGDGGEEDEWQVFFDVERRLLSETTMYPVLGNHEAFASHGKALFRRYFSLPEESLFPEQDYAFTFGNTRFVVLTAYEGFPDEQMEWLDEVLDAARQDPAIEHRFVFLHHGPYSSGYHGNNVEALRAGLSRALREGDVDIVFSGHDHDYERGRTSGINYVVSGGGGAPLYDVDTRRPGAEAFESTYHHVRVDVVGDAVEVTTVRPDGSIVDACTVVGGAAWRCSLPPRPPVVAPEANAAHHQRPVANACGSTSVAVALPLCALALVGLYARMRRARGSGI